MADRSDIEAIVLQACRDDGARAVLDKLMELMTPAAAKLWLDGNDPHLGVACEKVKYPTLRFCRAS